MTPPLPAAVQAACRDCDWWGTSATVNCPRCRSRRLARHGELFDLMIAHLDCDAFYASIEKRDDPVLRDKPVIVGGGRRGVVTTACYIARLSGVRSAMPMFKAVKLCPEAVVIPPAFQKYRTESRRILDKVRSLTPLVQPLSLDEAWLDLTGTTLLHGAPPAAVLARVQREIERDIGITVSIGLSANKFLAKIASELDKPRGFGVIGAIGAADFLAPRPVSILPGVGPVLARSLATAGFHTIGDLARADPATLARAHGAMGLRLAKLARGEDGRAVDPDQARKSLSAETTFETDLSDLVALEARLLPLCERVARQARKEGIVARSIGLKLRTQDFKIHSRSRRAPHPTQTARTIYEISRALLRETCRGQPFRLIGVALADLSPADESQALFSPPEARSLREETLIDDLRGRFGEAALRRGASLRR